MEILIESVKKHRALWDISAKAYKDPAKRLLAWNLVAEQCGLTQESAKSKWRGLRDTYKKFLKAQKRASEQGRKKRKKYCYAEQMGFMKPLGFNLKSSSRVTKETVSKKETKVVVEPCPVVENMSESLTQKDLKPISDDKNEFFGFFLKKQNSEREMDATDMLFLSYSKTLKTFSKRRQIMLKRKISEVFTETELEQVAEEEMEYVSSGCSFSNVMTSLENVPNPLDVQDIVECKIENS